MKPTFVLVVLLAARIALGQTADTAATSQPTPVQEAPVQAAPVQPAPVQLPPLQTEPLAPVWPAHGVPPVGTWDIVATGVLAAALLTVQFG